MKRLITTFLFIGFSVPVLLAQDPTRPSVSRPILSDNTLVDGGPDETMPLYPGCTEVDHQLKKQCAERKMLAYLSKNIKYPLKARRRNITGTVYAKFVVEKDGSLSKFEILQDIGGGCGKEVLRLLKAMPKWEPATQKGKPVRVQFTLPIKFDLK
ncbi:MAG: energy transducer TonB [Saprospiraceae bacterium]|nr:energy transducer TonB [Saprospiraceae bacterium]